MNASILEIHRMDLLNDYMLVYEWSKKEFYFPSLDRIMTELHLFFSEVTETCLLHLIFTSSF